MAELGKDRCSDISPLGFNRYKKRDAVFYGNANRSQKSKARRCVVNIQRRQISIVALSLFLIGKAMVPSPAFSQNNPSADDARCDRLAADAANAVRAQVPPLPATVPPPVQTFFRLMQREPLIAPADHRIYYGSHYSKFGDLRLPKKGSGPYPVAIVIHGGAWQSRVVLDYMAPLQEALTCAGIATWSIEYRRLGGDGGWPATFLDVAEAADFLRQLAKSYPLDLSRVVSVGHSSGGHLALWLAARHRLPKASELYTADPLPLRGVVSLAGVGDLANFYKVVPMYHDTVMQMLGAPSASSEQIAQRMKEASPAALLPLGVPQVLINGTVDPYVPLQLQQEYMPIAIAKGDRVRLIVVKDGGHFESCDPAHPQAGPAIRNAVLSLLGMARSHGSDNKSSP
jgi:acetyl esterase/lipase